MYYSGCAAKLGLSSLKQEQKVAVMQFLSKKYVFVMLPDVTVSSSFSHAEHIHSHVYYCYTIKHHICNVASVTRASIA